MADSRVSFQYQEQEILVFIDNMFSFFTNPYHDTGLFLPPENIRKPEIFWCFHGVLKVISGMKWVNIQSHSHHVFHQ